MKPLNGINTIVFDLDDTILDTGICYWKYIELFSEELSKKLNGRVSIGEIMRRQEEIDIEEVEYAGFTRQRFPRSFVKTYQWYAGKYGLPVTDELKKHYWDMADAVYDIVPGLLPGALETLSYLKKRNYSLILYTLGDENIQWKKINKHSLSNYFSDIHIVLRKEKETLAEVLNGRVPEKVAVVGDSKRGEIAPAVALGCKAFFIERESPWTYLINVDVPGEFTTITTLSELKTYF